METRILMVGLVLAIVAGAYVGWTMTTSAVPPAIGEPLIGDDSDGGEEMPLVENNTAIVNNSFANDSEIGKPCESDSDCRLPFSYAIISRCPYAMRCADNKCEAYCPWDETPPKENTTPAVENKPIDPNSWKGEIELSASTNKRVYLPKEEVSVNITIESGQAKDRCYVKIKGVKNHYGKSFVNQAQLVHLKPGRNEVVISDTLPACSSCSGIQLGEYDIDVWLEKTRR